MCQSIHDAVNTCINGSFFTLIISTVYVIIYSLCCDSGEHLLNIDSGRYVDYYEPPNQHFTVIFNTFVMMTFCHQSSVT